MVAQGQALYVLASSHHNAAGNTDALISAQVLQRKRLLESERGRVIALYGHQHSASMERISALEGEYRALASQLKDQELRTELAERTADRYDELAASGFVAAEQARAKREDALDQRVRQSGLAREQAGLQRQLAEMREALATLQPRHENALSDIDLQIASATQELTQTDSRGRVVVVAPMRGVVAARFAELGQWFDASRPLVTIVPAKAELECQLYLPPRASGFVKPGDRVRLRFAAFPYQKFGHYPGIVTSVSAVALSEGEMTGVPGQMSHVNPQLRGPIYRATVQLLQQTVSVYGVPRPLQAGMLVEAEILQEKRRLFEWLAQPLLGLSRSV